MANTTVSEAADDAWRRRHAALEASILDARARRAASRRQRNEARIHAFGDFCEASEGLAVVWRRENTPLEAILAYAGDDLWLLQTLSRYLRLTSTRKLDRLRHSERRPIYYAQEKLRRQELAAARRAARRHTTTNPCPTKELILDAWGKVRNSNEDLIRFGSIMEDLACHVDSSLLRTEDGAIVGRRGGIKAWLQLNIPALYLKYKTVMAYKAAAKKLRQITDLPEPMPVTLLVGEEPPIAEDESTETTVVEQPAETPVKVKEPIATPVSMEKTTATPTAMGEPTVLPIEVLRARAIYLEVMKEPPRSRSALRDRINAFVDPERVAESTTLTTWKERYRLKITVRTKSKWMLRLWRRTKAVG